MIYKATDTKTSKLKWIIYIAVGLSILVFVMGLSKWHFITKTLIAFPIFINLLFDIYYLKKVKSPIESITFNDSTLIISRINRENIQLRFSDLKYSIRKRKFEKHKTEIELKLKRNLRCKTIERLNIKNWNSIFEIEKELEENKIVRVEWKPQTLWAKYWGIFIDLFFITVADDVLGTTDYQEKAIQENTENPIKKRD